MFKQHSLQFSVS